MLNILKGKAMNAVEDSSVFQEFIGHCNQCGKCTNVCPSLTSANMTLGDIAKTLNCAITEAEGDSELSALIVENHQLIQSVRGCFLCRSCQKACVAKNDVGNLIYSARAVFQNAGLIPREAWSSVEVDREWNIFSAYRAIYNIDFQELICHHESGENHKDEPCEIAFFPGCTMAAYAPELTREIFQTIEELGGKTTFIDGCCGSPLKSAGFFQRAETLCDQIALEIARSGASQVLCVCPGCMNDLVASFKRNNLAIEAKTLSAFLLERGFTSSRGIEEGTWCFSKSCQDREDAYLKETRALLKASLNTPLLLNGCCGAGGAVSAFDFHQHEQQIARKLSAVQEGAIVVSLCPTCAYTFASYLRNHPQLVANKHYAELLFENQFDWDKVFDQLTGMWRGEYGPWLAEVFA